MQFPVTCVSELIFVLMCEKIYFWTDWHGTWISHLRPGFCSRFHFFMWVAFCIEHYTVTACCFTVAVFQFCKWSLAKGNIYSSWETVFSVHKIVSDKVNVECNLVAKIDKWLLTFLKFVVAVFFLAALELWVIALNCSGRWTGSPFRKMQAGRGSISFVKDFHLGSALCGL